MGADAVNRNSAVCFKIYRLKSGSSHEDKLNVSGEYRYINYFNNNTLLF